jgi:hypothetical protein
VFLLLLVAPACGPQSALVNLWVDRTHAPEPTENVLVVALWRDEDARRIWEERFAEVLEHSDADAVPSYVGLSAPMPDSVTVFREANQRKCGGVIVVHAPVLDDSYYVPGFTRPETMKHPHWYTGRTAASSINAYSGWPPVRYDVEMWSPQNAKMVWAGTAEVVDAGDDDHAAHEVADKVVLELARLGLVPSQY